MNLINSLINQNFGQNWKFRRLFIGWKAAFNYKYLLKILIQDNWLISIIGSVASVNTLQCPFCCVLAHGPGGVLRGWAGVGERWRRRGIWMIDKCQIANIFSKKVQRWIFCCLIPCMFPNMRVPIQFFVMHTCIQLNLVPWISDIRYSGVLSLPGNSIYRKLNKARTVNDPASNDDGVNWSKLDIPKESTKQMIEWTFPKIGISKQNANNNQSTTL